MEKFDVIVVGAGLAGLTAAYHLAKNGLNVAVFERGEYPGSKNLAGGVLYSTVLRKIIPDFTTKAPLERYVAKKRFYLLSESSSLTFEFSTRKFDTVPHNDSYTILRAKFDRWLAHQVEEAGAMIIPETVVDDLIRKNGKVKGILSRRAEGEVYADLVIVADGANSLLSNSNVGFIPRPEHFTLGAKEVVKVPKDVIEERFGLSGNRGLSMQCFGYPQGILGSGFIYTNRESISLGIVAYLDSLVERKMNIFDLLQSFKRHDTVRDLIGDGETMEYSAHLIPEKSRKEIHDDGLLIVGDAAGLLNRSPIFFEGTNLAMASGLTAAQVAVEANQEGDYSKRKLALYPHLLSQSHIMKDVEKYEKVPNFVRKHPRIISDYPRFLNDFVAEILKIDETPKSTKVKRACKGFRKATFLWDMYLAWRTLL